jgi:RHS repeat-associated protein
VNGVCTRHSYDAFGRPLRRWEAVVQGSAWETDAEAETAWIYLSPGEPAAGGLAAVQNYVVVEWRNPRCMGNFERRHYNGLGQLVRQQRPQQEWTLSVEGCTPGQSGGEVDIDSAYNALGLPSRVSTPTGNDYATWPTRRSDWPQGSYTETSYDALGRVTRVVAPNGESSRHFYGGRESSLVLFGRNGDGNKLAQWQVTDGLGNLRHVRSYTPNGAGWLLEGQVTLTHDELGNLRQVTHPTGAPSTGSGQAITTLSYGLGGRKTSINDPDLGAWSYGYDRQGRPTRQTDARGKTTCLYYDVLGRLVGKDFNQSSGGNCAASASMEVSYSYDTGHGETQRSRGQLTQVAYSDLSYRQELGYDAFGRLVSQAVSIADAGQPFISETYYDAYQRTVGLASPDGEVVKTSYNSMGLPRQLCEASWQSTTGELACLDGQPALVDNAHYDAAGRLTSMELSAGGGLWREQEYYPWSSSDGNSNGRLAEVRLGTVAGGNDLLRLHYSYDSFGNVSELQERYGSEAQQSQRFCYDAQNRLVRGYAPASAAFDCASATAGQRYSYDAAGRLTNYEGTAFTAGALRAHLSLPGGAFAGLAYAVDGNGNLTKRGDAQLVWDHENRLVMFSRSGTIGYPGPPVASGATSELTPEPIEGGGTVSTWSEKESYLYDADGVRVKKVAPNGAATYTPFPHYEVSDGVVTKYYFFAGQRIAMKRNGVLTYLHSDHLGSIVATTNISGALTSSRGYRAYGNYRRGGDLPTDYRFTGQKQDASGLVYMNARYYDPVLGQFISPDTLVPDAGNVQDYNRYGYTRGNPMKFNDPSGHYSNDEIMQHYGCGDWGCVEAQFGDGGSHAGLWGWLYILQQAVDGDSVASFNYSGADGIAGTINSALQGVFQRDGNGQINVRATGWSTSGGGESNQQAMSAVVPEVGFAAFAGNANVFGSYGLVGAAGVFATNAHHKHNYLSVDPGQAAIAGLKAGADFGPLIIAAAPAAGPAAPIVASVGVGYTVIGASVSLVVDVALPVAQAFMGNTRPAWESIGVETVSQSSRYFGRIGEQVAPFVGPVYDLGKAICYGTGCSR